MNAYPQNSPFPETTIFQAGSLLLDTVVCDALTRSGIPARLSFAGAYGVEVPGPLAMATRRLLSGGERSGEIYCYAGEGSRE